MNARQTQVAAEEFRRWQSSPAGAATLRAERDARLNADRAKGHVVPDESGGYGCGLLRCVPECRAKGGAS